MKPKLVIYWCRRDFRLTDNPALTTAIEYSQKNQTPFLPIFILDSNILSNLENLENSKNYSENNSQISTLQNNSTHFSSHLHVNIGFPRRLFLSRILASFSLQFPIFEILIGDFQEIFQNLSRVFELQVFANSDVEPFSRFRDAKIAEILPNSFQTFADQMTVSPDLRTQTGQIYSIFTPFKNAALESFLNAQSLPKADLSLLPSFNLDSDNLNPDNLKTNFQPILRLISNNSETKKTSFEPNSNEKQANLDIPKKIKELFPDFQNSQNSEDFKNENSKNQNSENEIAKITVNSAQNSQNKTEKANQKNNQNYRLEKKLNFTELQVQILAIIDTDWTFNVAKHFAKNDEKIETEKIEKAQNQLFGNDSVNGNYQDNSQSKYDLNSDIFGENNSHFQLNLDKIIKRPDFLEWKWIEGEVLADFDDFLENKILNYKEKRDDLALDTVNSGQTSKISYALKWGLVSSRFLKQKIVDKFGLQTQSQVGIVHFMSELMWREFYRYVLFHEPLVLNLESQSRFRPRINSGKIMEIKAKLTQEKIAKILNLKTEN